MAFEISGEARVQKLYSVSELIRQPWFPVKAHQTVMNYIRSGRLKATDANSQPKRKNRRYVVAHADAIEFIVRLEDGTFAR